MTGLLPELIFIPQLEEGEMAATAGFCRLPLRALCQASSKLAKVVICG
jgi:hypothetical protein